MIFGTADFVEQTSDGPFFSQRTQRAQSMTIMTEAWFSPGRGHGTSDAVILIAKMDNLSLVPAIRI